MNKETKKLQKLVGKRKIKKIVSQSREYNQYKNEDTTSDYDSSYDCN